MQVVLWDTRKFGVSKDFAGGFGVGQYPGHGGFRGRIIRRFYTRDRRPVALLFGHLASIFRRLGYEVRYTEDRIPGGADLYVFCPSLITLNLERRAMASLLAQKPNARVLVVGLTASVMPEAFEGLDVTIVKGEAEQLLWKLDEVLARPRSTVQLGTIEDLDRLPLPDWSPLGPKKFRIGYDFWKFPTALVQASRGCTFKCNYCPYIILENATRFRNPGAVAEEIRYGIRRWGFQSFKFRDPLFGLNRKLVFQLAEHLGRLPRKIQFSIETRIDLMRPEILRLLKRVGLTSITVGIETPDDATLRRYRRAPIKDDRQQEFVALCRSMGIRTVAGFMIGFPDDTEQSIRNVLHYAQFVNPSMANFNIVTPYPGTEFFEGIRPQIADFDFSRYTVYTPVMKYENLTAERVQELHAKCFNRFYFRWGYLRDNANVFWPRLAGWWRRTAKPAMPQSEPGHDKPPRPTAGMEALQSKQGLRPDGPHTQSDAANSRSDRPSEA